MINLVKLVFCKEGVWQYDSEKEILHSYEHGNVGVAAFKIIERKG